jgi:hypothetical protein
VAFVTALFGGCARERGVESPQRVVSVCDILANLESYRGKVVTVRGAYTYIGLRQDGCPAPFVTGDHRWPPILNLTDAVYKWPGDPPLVFKTDYESWDRLERTALRAGKQGRSVEIWATITGQVRAQPGYLLPDKRVRGGYGPGATLPAELVVKRVVDIEVKPVSHPRYDYRPPRARPE